MTDKVEDFLEHHGIMGMKWGVRNGPVSASGERFGMGVAVRGLPEPTVQNTLLASKMAEAVHSLAFSNFGSNELHKKNSKKINPGLDALNKKYPNITSDEEHRAYRSEVVKHFTKILNSNVPKGYYGQVLQPPKHTSDLVVIVGNKTGLKNEIENFKKLGFIHSESDSVVQVYTLKATLDSSNHIVGLEVFPESVSHIDEVEDFLEHHGILGMKWGIRRSENQLHPGSSSTNTSSGSLPWQSPHPTLAKAKPSLPTISKLSSRHVKGIPSHDALVVSNLRARAKKHGLHTLTNDEIRALTNRADLASKYAKSFPKKPSKLGLIGKVAVMAALSDLGQGAIVKKLGKTPEAQSKLAEQLKTLSSLNKTFSENKNKKK